MELTTSLVTALAAGAVACATNLATQPIQEAYDGLKTLMGQRFWDMTNGKELVAQLEAEPAAAEPKRILAERLTATIAQRQDPTADAQLARLATTLLQFIAAEEQITGLSMISPGQSDIVASKAAHAVRSSSAAPTPIALQPGLLSKQAVAVDPKLQRATPQALVEKGVAARRADASPKLLAESASVDLIGQLKDPNVPVPGLQISRQVGTLFTATAAAKDIAAITQHENIVMVQSARPLSPTLALSVPEIGGTPAQLRAALPDEIAVPDGRGVIIGIVDYGCDFVHPNFCHADGTTRILALWHQAGPFVEGLSPQGFSQGREFAAAAINAALQTQDPYQTLGYDPGVASHGTHVMDIAAGNGRATGNPGVAPKAHIVFVHVGNGHTRQDRAGNERNVMEAVDYIFQKAAALGCPAVVNISMGTHAGPHDGSTPPEQWFDQLLQTPNRAIVISAGNSWRHRAHAQGVATPAQPALLPWIIQPTDTTDNEMEIWYSGAHALIVSLLEPGGSRLATVSRGYTQSLVDAAGHEVVSIIHNEQVASNGDHQINIWLDKSLTPSGSDPAIWQIQLHSNGTEDVPFHAWIERDDSADATQSFFHPRVVSTSHTLGSIACGKLTIVVGSYMTGDPEKGLSAFSSAGPTRDGRQKPEISAPGQHGVVPPDCAGILAAESRTKGLTRKSGTSMAAPHVTGLIALLLQTAESPLASAQIRERLLQTVRTVPAASAAWHPRYGFGQLDAVAALLNKTPLPQLNKK